MHLEIPKVPFALVEGWYSLEQYIGFEVRLAFNYYCSLHQVWREAEN